MEVKTFTRVSKPEEDRETVLRMPSLSDIVPSALMLLLARSSLAGMYPFVCAFFAASFDKRTAYMGILSMIAGLLTAGEGVGGMRFAFAAVIYWLYSYIKDDRKSPVTSAVVCGGGVLICGGMFLPYTEPTLYGVIRLFAESVITGFLYIAFARAGTLVRGRESRTGIGREELICLAVCAGGVINGFSGIRIPMGIELTRIFTMYAIIVISLYASMGTAVIGSVLIGICTAANMGNALFLVGLYAVCAVFSSMLRGFGRPGAVIGFIGGGVMGLLFTGSVFDFPVRLSELILAACAFMLTPKKLMREIASFLTRTFHTEALRTDLRVKSYLCERLDKISSSFKCIEESFNEISARRSLSDCATAGELFDAVSDKVCKTCGMCRQCWQTDFDSMYERMFSLLEIMEQKGYCDLSDAPREFKDKCVRAESFLEEFSHKYELYKNRAVWRDENDRARRLIVKQYSEMSDVLAALSLDIQNGFSFLDETEDRLIECFDREGLRVREVSVIENGSGAVEVFVRASFGTSVKALAKCISAVVGVPVELKETDGGICRFTSCCNYTVEVATQQRPKSGQTCCGDSVIHFRTPDNRYCVAICDGMGSGELADEESRFSAELLRRLIRSGISETTAVGMINSALTLKSGGESFSTIDIFVFDLMDGSCEFVKTGGAESFVKSSDGIEVILSRTLPAGALDEVSADSIRRRLKNGDTVVMATDGVTGAGGCEADGWIKRAMEDDSDMDMLAGRIMENAAKKDGGECRDDMTVAAIRIKKTA